MPTAPILALGARWLAEDVYWDSAPKNGKLLGVRTKNLKGPVANFAHQTGIYILYSDFVPIYVGQANQTLFARLRQHARKDDLVGRWDRFSWFGFRKVLGGKSRKLSKPDPTFHISTAQLLDHLEAALIHSFEPSMNGQEGRFGPGVTRFKQIRDERLGPADRDLLELMAKNGELLPKGTTITKSGWKSVP